MMTDSPLSETKKNGFANYRMDVRYDGQHYYGWQRHKDKPTVQGALEDAVTKCFGFRLKIEGSGRTDRGTHALGQVASIRLPEDIDEEAAVVSLNDALDKAIEVTNLQKVSDDFHARDSAVGKCYRYKIWNHVDLPPAMEGKVWYIPAKLDVEAMQNACPFFVGKMDYASFAKVPNFKRATTLRTVHSLDLRQDGFSLCFSIIADGFLYKMVRNIIRVLVKVGESKTSSEDLPRIIKAKNRQAAPGTAPASGLYLDAVFYDKNSLDAAIQKNRKDQD
ncbi:MAG: tRNA pseudouridine(38-40) synthase TruA [Desulfobacteraceae bacterium]|nr:tRNA pseudouridine(38-40) synthase TruA [Desulfobacteraceae bacterium]